MRGIQINNYFNNHITLNGKKPHHEQPTHPLEHPKPKTLNHNHYLQADPQHIESKSPTKHQQPPSKKRTNTLLELKKHIPSKRSVSTERQRNAVSAKKKEDAASEDSNKQEQPLTNMSHRKLKPSGSKGGLGKRSKSTIIKPGFVEMPKSTVKKESKKFSSNPTDESIKPKSKRKKSSKIIQASRQIKPQSKEIVPKKKLIPTASKQGPKKEKLFIKLDRCQKGEQKKPIKSAKPNSTGPSKKKQSKPASARERKPKNNRFIEELKQKYENQTILEGELSHRIKAKEENIDDEFMSVMNSLEKVLTSVGNKQKLKQELKIINQKLNEFKLHSDSDQEEAYHSNQKEAQQYGSAQIKKEKEEHQSEQEEQSDEEPLKHKIEENADNQSNTVQEISELNPLLGKRNGGFFMAQEEYINGQSNGDMVERKKQIEILKKFKNQSTKMMQKVGLNSFNPEPIEDNKQKPQIQKVQALEQQQKKEINNDSNLSSNNGNQHILQTKYPVGGLKSPKFDQMQLMGIISLKEQFMTNKHDKLSQLVTKMFQKELVSPKSFEQQIKSLKKKYEDENIVLESLKKQAEQMSSMLSQIKKDKEQIIGIDELIRNEKWQQAKKFVKPKPHHEIAPTTEDKIVKHAPLKRQKYAKNQFELEGWEKEQGWERVEIKQSDIENNQFVDLEEMNKLGKQKQTTRIKRVHLVNDVDIDQECGGTEESIELHEEAEKHSDQEFIYYNGENESEEKHQAGGFIKLVQIDHDQKDQTASNPTLIEANTNVFHIENKEAKEKTPDSSIIQKNQSNLSAVSSQSERKGFTTNLYFIKQYCIALCEFVRDSEIFKSQFKSNISKPLTFNLPELLKMLRSEDLTDYLYSKRTSKIAISEYIWNEFNAQYDTLKYNLSQNKSADRYKFQKQQEIIFARMIYDVLNESLDFERPGSQFGKAFPWNENSKHLKNIKQLSQPEKDNIEAYDLMFGVAIARIIQWGSCLCGFLPDTVELQNTEIDEPYVNHIRQTRMAFLLQKMMAAEQAIMINFQMQQTEIQFRLSQLIAEELMSEAVQQLELTLFNFH